MVDKRKTNKEQLSKFRDYLKLLSLELDGSYPWSQIDVLDNALSIVDICFHGVHPKFGGIKNLREKLLHYKMTHNVPASQKKIQT